MLLILFFNGLMDLKSHGRSVKRFKIEPLVDNSEERCRDWGLLIYLFRGVGQNLPLQEQLSDKLTMIEKYFSYLK